MTIERPRGPSSSAPMLKTTRPGSIFDNSELINDQNLKTIPTFKSIIANVVNLTYSSFKFVIADSNSHLQMSTN